MRRQWIVQHEFSDEPRVRRGPLVEVVVSTYKAERQDGLSKAEARRAVAEWYEVPVNAVVAAIRYAKRMGFNDLEAT